MSGAKMSRNPNETQRRLLVEAQRQFCSYGYHGTDSNRIARDAGFSPQTFYRHFPDKRAVFLEVYEVFSRAVMARVVGATSARGLARSIVQLHKEWGAFRSSLISLYTTDEVVREVRAATREAQLNDLVTLLGIDRPAALFLIWSCERLADGIASGEAKAMKVSEAALIDQFSSLQGARWKPRTSKRTKTAS